MVRDEKRKDAGDDRAFFSRFHNGEPTDSSLPSFQPGDEVGRYTVVEVLGEGGYGIVYLAEQQQPIKRHVALKVIKPGMDSKTVLARFETERQALALLEHPSIARIIDAGTTDTGHPYFVMEYVDGRPITEFCDARRYTIEQRLKLFVDVCSAVQHAHQKGIIHRDIKPSNIIVVDNGEMARAKVIDFGIAKAVGSAFSSKMTVTEQGQLIGTPGYMSPEQVDMVQQAIDTRSDIYSLGASLYELVTGVMPFDPESLGSSGIENLKRVICEQDPPHPSKRLTDIGDSARDVADARRTQVAVLKNRLHHELEWIPLKAMRKEPERRYQSASELAEDIQNYLTGNALIAGPDTIGYRVRKLLRRHWVAMAAMMAVLVSLSVGLTLSTWLYFKAKDAGLTAQKAQSKAEVERGKATEAEQQTQQLLADMYVEQSRQFVQTDCLDEALILLSEAYRIDTESLYLQFLLVQCLRQHTNPILHAAENIIRWDFGYDAAENLSLVTSGDRSLVAFMDRTNNVVTVFETNTGRRLLQLSGMQIDAFAFAPDDKYCIVRTNNDSALYQIGVIDLTDGHGVASIPRTKADVHQLCEQGDIASSRREQIKTLYESVHICADHNCLVFVDVNSSEDPLTSELKLWDFSAEALYVADANEMDSLITGVLTLPESIYGWRSKVATLHANSTHKQWSIPNLKVGHQGVFESDYVTFGPRGRTMFNVKMPAAELMDRKGNVNTLYLSNTVSGGYSPDGKTLIVKRANISPDMKRDANPGFLTELWNTHRGAQIVTIEDCGLDNWHFTPDSQLVITEHNDGRIRISQTSDGALIAEMSPSKRLKVVDISPNSHWMVLRTAAEPYTLEIYDLRTAETYSGWQLTAGEICTVTRWVYPTVDQVFAFSHVPPADGALFNADASYVITRQGLRPFSQVSLSADRLHRLVRAFVPLRLENGKIRDAYAWEMRTAEADYYCAEEGSSSQQGILCV